MNEMLADMLYILGCGVNGRKPDGQITGRYADADRLSRLYQISRAHFLDALTGTVIKHAGIHLPAQWEEAIAKSIRKVMLFDAERAKLFQFMEQKGIWYMPLKGVILKSYYPSIGMRQMSDNDILFDAAYASVIRMHMESQGYETKAYGTGNHDVYEKPPVYNFEMHTALYGAGHRAAWVDYYRDIKDRLLPDAGSRFGLHMREEDFYVYIMTHAYKHFSSSGTGVRTLLDFYVYLHGKEEQLDFSYIECECSKLGIAEFEQKSRKLCHHVFDCAALEQYETKHAWMLSGEETDMLRYYFSSGVYGTKRQQIENKLREYGANGSTSVKARLRYIKNRIFPGMEVYQYYPFSKHKWTLPLCWLYRIFCVLSDRTRRNDVRQEAKLLRKL